MAPHSLGRVTPAILRPPVPGVEVSCQLCRLKTFLERTWTPSTCAGIGSSSISSSLHAKQLPNSQAGAAAGKCLGSCVHQQSQPCGCGLLEFRGLFLPRNSNSDSLLSLCKQGMTPPESVNTLRLKPCRPFELKVAGAEGSVIRYATSFHQHTTSENVCPFSQSCESSHSGDS